jgi:hypothetical protein
MATVLPMNAGIADAFELADRVFGTDKSRAPVT